MKVSFNAATDLSLSPAGPMMCFIWYGKYAKLIWNPTRHTISGEKALTKRQLRWHFGNKKRSILEQVDYIFYACYDMMKWNYSQILWVMQRSLFHFTDSCVLVRISLNYFKGGKNSSLKGLKALLVCYTSKATTLYTLARRLLLSRSRQAKFKKLRNRYPWDTRKKI